MSLLINPGLEPMDCNSRYRLPPRVMHYSGTVALGITAFSLLVSSFYYAGKLIESGVKAIQGDDIVLNAYRAKVLGTGEVVLGLGLMGGGILCSATCFTLARKILRLEIFHPDRHLNDLRV